VPVPTATREECSCRNISCNRFAVVWARGGCAQLGCTQEIFDKLHKCSCRNIVEILDDDSAREVEIRLNRELHATNGSFITLMMAISAVH
jgi:hypothetical protein